ncbi:MAG: hypothetical protein K6T88_10020 [Bacillus sp. (in: Bacteria)]|nr:hypothetical protein [Bacillus sp. (in: firmicutes)]
MRKVKIRPFTNLFAKNKKRKGSIWASASLLVIGVGAAIFGVTRGKNKDFTLPIQNIVKNFSAKTNLNQMDNTAITEFSEELLTSALKNKR